MHPNKFRCAWLGQGCVLKVVLEGSEGAMMLGAEKIDRSKISVLPKTGENWEIVCWRVLRHFRRIFRQLRPRDVKELDELSTFTRSYADHRHLMHVIEPHYNPRSPLEVAPVSIEVRRAESPILTHARVNRLFSTLPHSTHDS